MLINQTTNLTDYIDTFAKKIGSLTLHSFIAKSQRQYLRCKCKKFVGSIYVTLRFWIKKLNKVYDNSKTLHTKVEYELVISCVGYNM